MKYLSLIIVSYNTRDILMECLGSVIKYINGIDYEIIIVDNASTDDSVKAVKDFIAKNDKKDIRVIVNKINLGFGSANNVGIKKSNGKYILLLNSDCVLKDDSVQKMVFWMDKHPKVGVSSCSLLNKDETIQGTGGYFPTIIRVFSWMIIQDIPFIDRLIKPFHPMKSKSMFKDEGFYKKEKYLDWVTGAFFLMRKDVVKNCGYFDQDYHMYTEEVDYCYRIKKMGWKVFYNPNYSVIHLGGASGKVGENIYQEFQGIKLFYRKHYPKWQYPLLRILLKIGSLIRIFLFGILEGREAAGVYAKTFIEA